VSSLASQKLTRFAYIARYAGRDLDRDLFDIINASRRNNPRDGLSGVLLFDDGHFIQVVEGPGTNVTRLMMRVLSDPRATDVGVLCYELVDERAFGGFVMLPLRLDGALSFDPLVLRFREAYRQAAKVHDVATCLPLLQSIVRRAVDRGGPALVHAD
jgi:hypothetical protein